MDDPNGSPDLFYRNPEPKFLTNASLMAARRRRQLSGPRTDFGAMAQPDTPSEWGRAIEARGAENADRIQPTGPPQPEASLAGARKRKRVPFNVMDPESRAAHPIKSFIVRTLGAERLANRIEREDARREGREERADAREDSYQERQDARRRAAEQPAPEGWVNVGGKLRNDPTYSRPKPEIDVPEELQDEFASVGGQVKRRRPAEPAMPSAEERAERAKQGYWWDPQGSGWRSDRSFATPHAGGAGKGAPTIPPAALRGIITRHEIQIRAILQDIQKKQAEQEKLKRDPNYNGARIAQLDDSIEESTQTLDDLRGELDGMRNEYNAMKPKGPLQDMPEEFNALPEDRQRAYLEQYRRPGAK